MGILKARGRNRQQMAKAPHIPRRAKQLAATAATLSATPSSVFDDPREQVTMRIVNRMWPEGGLPDQAP